MKMEATIILGFILELYRDNGKMETTITSLLYRDILRKLFGGAFVLVRPAFRAHTGVV